MKQALLIFCFLQFSVSVFSQQPPVPDSRLLETFELEYLERIQSDNPVLLERLNYYLDHAWYLTEYPTEKADPGFEVIEIDELDNIQIFSLEKMYDLSRDFEKRSVYRIAGTQQVLVFYSGREFNERFNEHRNSK